MYKVLNEQFSLFSAVSETAEIYWLKCNRSLTLAMKNGGKMLRSLLIDHEEGSGRF